MYLMFSAGAPAVSTPVGPPPTTSMLPDCTRSAVSSVRVNAVLSRTGSDTGYSGYACSSAPGVLKKPGTAPVAMTRIGPWERVPSAVVTAREAASSAVASVVSPRTSLMRRNAERSVLATAETPICDAAICQSRGWTGR